MLGKVGGDSALSEAGEEYALKLAEYVDTEVLKEQEPRPTYNLKRTRLWTSSLKRTIATARHVKHTVSRAMVSMSWNRRS